MDSIPAQPEKELGITELMWLSLNYQKLHLMEQLPLV